VNIYTLFDLRDTDLLTPVLDGDIIRQFGITRDDYSLKPVMLSSVPWLKRTEFTTKERAVESLSTVLRVQWILQTFTIWFE